MDVARSVSLDVLVEHLERLDTVAVVAMVEEAVGDGRAISDVVGSLLLPAWRQLDERAGDGEVDRATIGAAAVITRRALARAVVVAGPAAVASNRAPVMVVSSSTSADVLGADVVGELVTAAGWPVDVLSGPPMEDEIVAHLKARRPAALIVTFVETVDLPNAGRMIAAAHGEGIPVIAWGPAFGTDALRTERLGAAAWAPSLEAITSTLEQWHTSAPALVAAPELPAGYAELEADRAALLIATAKISGGDGEANHWAQRTALRVLGQLSAAVLVGDSRVLTEHLDMERRELARHQLLDVHLLGLVDALAGALPETTGPARAYVLACRDELREALVSSRPRPTGIVTVSSRPARSFTGEVGGAAPEAPETVGPGGNRGQSFTDILLLASLSCQTPFALVSVPQSKGKWNTLSHGFEQRDGLNDARLFDFVAARIEPIEIADLSNFPSLSGCPLSAPPHSLRWIYAAPLRDPAGKVLGVVAVLDKWLREGSRREQRAMLAVSRQMGALLSQRRQTVPAPVAAPGSPTWPVSTGVQVAPAATNGRGAGRSVVGVRRAVTLPEGQQLLRSHEVAVLFDVTERTVINWAAANKLPSLRTIGGHLRFHSEDVLELLAGRTSGQRPAVGD
jgi:excisionase family DNA binding protein